MTAQPSLAAAAVPPGAAINPLQLRLGRGDLRAGCGGDRLRQSLGAQLCSRDRGRDVDGIDLFMGFVIGPILRAAPFEARRAIITRLTPKTLFLMPALSISTGTSGWFLAERLGFLDLAYPQFYWVVAALAIVTILTIQGLGYLLPTNLRVYLELRKPRPDGAEDRRPDEPVFLCRRLPGRDAGGDHRGDGEVRDWAVRGACRTCRNAGLTHGERAFNFPRKFVVLGRSDEREIVLACVGDRRPWRVARNIRTSGIVRQASTQRLCPAICQAIKIPRFRLARSRWAETRSPGTTRSTLIQSMVRETHSG